MSDVTKILSAIERGEQEAAEKLLPLVYQELRNLASAKLAKERPGHTLQPTMLVHEAYLRLVDREQPQQWNGRRHFFAAAAESMRRILVENARRKLSRKRGGGMERVELGEVELTVENSKVQQADELLALDKALTHFEQLWPEKAQLVKLRYFTGLTVPEAAQTLDVSVATAERYWKFAKAWLLTQLRTG